MSDPAPEHVPVRRETPPEDPSKRTGAEDPFTQIDPEDPLGLKSAEADPYRDPQPVADPTTNGGAIIAPPLSPPPPAETPDRARLRALSVRPDPGPSTAVNVVNKDNAGILRRVQAGRAELGDHWTKLRSLVLTGAETRAKSADQADMAALRARVEAESDLSRALDDWCAARDATPPEEDKLADALERAKSAVADMKASFGAGNLGRVEEAAGTVTMVADSFIQELQIEAAEIVEGQRVAERAPSDAVVERMLMGTPDDTLQVRLANNATWERTGVYLRSTIGSQTLTIPLNRTAGVVDLAQSNQRMTELDDAISARERALKAGEPVDYQTRAVILEKYLGLVDALSVQLEKVRTATGTMSSTWTPEKVRETADLLSGMIRHVAAELAVDPLVQDPDLASAARRAVDAMQDKAGRTSHDEAGAQLGTDMHKAWGKAKKALLARLKKEGVKTDKLSAAFDQGLGKSLDAWASEIKKFPRHDRARMRDIAEEVTEAMTKYRTAIDIELGKKRRSSTFTDLDAIAVALTRQIRSYDQRGGLF